MGKIIPSWELSQANEIKRLTTENDELRDENNRLKSEIARLAKSAYGRCSPSKPKSEPQLIAPATSTPSYMMPTQASSSKSATMTEQKSGSNSDEHEDDRSPFYEDGKLVRVGVVPELPHHQQSTLASVQRQVYPQHSNSWGLRRTREGTTLMELNQQPPREESSSELDGNITIQCSACDHLEAFVAAPGTNGDYTVSHLEENAWHDTPEAQVAIPYRVQSRLLNSALRIAQDALFNAGRIHWPLKQRFHWLGGPREVKFGHGELDGVFGDPGRFPYGREHGHTCEWPSDKVRSAVFAVTALRNAVCHSCRLLLPRVDQLIRSAQRLAVVFGDEARAAKVRALRSELHKEARKAHEEIEGLCAMRALPFPSRQQWALHHQCTFEDIVDAYKYRNDHWVRPSLVPYNKVSTVVKQAAWDWHFTTQRAGFSDWEWLKLLERAKAKVTINEVPASGRPATLGGIEHAQTSDKTDLPEDLTDAEFKAFSAPSSVTEKERREQFLSRQSARDRERMELVKKLIDAEWDYGLILVRTSEWKERFERVMGRQPEHRDGLEFVLNTVRAQLAKSKGSPDLRAWRERSERLMSTLPANLTGVDDARTSDTDQPFEEFERW